MKRKRRRPENNSLQKRRLDLSDLVAIVLAGILPLLIIYGTIGAGCFLTLYLALRKIPTLSGLHSEVISSYRCCGYKKSDGNIEIEADGKRFWLVPRVYGYSTNKTEALVQLQRSSVATIWLENKDSRTLLGIRTDYFYVNPEDGLKAERLNLRWGWAAAVMSLLCGVILHYSSYEKEARDALKFYFEYLKHS